MKAQFVFNDRKYITPSKKEGKKFLRFWGDRSAMVRRFRTGWNLKAVERGPCWAPVSIVDDKWQVEYGPSKDMQTPGV